MASRKLIQALATELAKPQGILIARAIIAELLAAAIKGGNVPEITRLAKLNEMANAEPKEASTTPFESPSKPALTTPPKSK